MPAARRFTWLAGLAELTAPGLWAVGARGFTSGLVNVAPAIPLAMLAALRRRRLTAAMTIWDAIRPFEELRGADSSADNVSVVKEALAQLGVCGRAVRPPGRLLPESARPGWRRSWPPGTLPGGSSRVTGTGKTPQQLRSYRWFGGDEPARPGCARSATARGCASSASPPPTTSASRSSRS